MIGSAFYLIAHVEGRIFWDPALPELEREGAPADLRGDGLGLARLHAIDVAAAGLSDGKPGSYFAWQFSADQAVSRERNRNGRRHGAAQHHRPAATSPSTTVEFALVHGDLRIYNMIFDANAPRLLAVLDWELSAPWIPLRRPRLPVHVLAHAQRVERPRRRQPGCAGQHGHSGAFCFSSFHARDKARNCLRLGIPPPWRLHCSRRAWPFGNRALRLSVETGLLSSRGGPIVAHPSCRRGRARLQRRMPAVEVSEVGVDREARGSGPDKPSIAVLPFQNMKRRSE